MQKNNIIKKMKLNKKRVLSNMLVGVLSIGACLSMTGCGIIKSSGTKLDERYIATSNSKALYSGQYYVWHDENQTDIASDINVDVSKFKSYGYNIFQPVYMENSLSSDTNPESSKRVLWVLAENDSRIPTLYKGDELIYYSDETIPSKISLERFYDHGYSVGVYGLTENMTNSQNYILKNDDTCGLKSGSSAAKIATLFKEEGDIISFPYIGDQEINTDDISKAGTIKGLLTARGGWLFYSDFSCIS